MLKRFVQYYKPHRWMLALDISCALVVSLIDLVVPKFTSTLIDSILPQQNVQALVVFCLVLAGIYLLRAGFQYVVDYWGHILGVKMEYDMRNALFAHIQRLPISFFDNYKVGKLMSRLVNDLNEIAEVAHHGPEDVLISLVILVGSFTAMFLANAKLATILLCVIPFLFYFGVTKNIKFRKTFKALKQQLANINARSEDNFSGIRIVKAFAQENFEVERFCEGNDEFNQAKQRSYKVMAEFTVSIKTFINFIQLLVFFFGGLYIIRGEMTIGELTAFMLYVQLFQQPVAKISNFIMQYNQAMAGFDRFCEIMDLEAQPSGQAHLPESIQGEIEFDDVTFQYEVDSKPVLQNLSFAVEPGKTMAIVGRSGGGKTTLCSLIPRFYELSAGKILLDGIDIKSVDLQNLRSSIGIVQQDVFIFAGSIRDNILYGRSDATEEELIEAARNANALEFIERLPEGLDTYIGERGVKLSGGQKQRISIARMFLKNPKLLILDEATSALDNESEVLIQTALNTLAKNRTTLIIAHRLSTIVGSDEIMVIEDGKIMERGHHNDLMSAQGLYYQLHQAGFSDMDLLEAPML
ncbi:MAG: ABC transporter ATP-binding protein [Erysipelotrichaceae bacterium]